MDITIKVFPSSRHPRVELSKNGSRFEIYVASPAEGGKANEEARELLSHHFNVELKKVVITRGTHQPQKIVHIYE